MTRKITDTDGETFTVPDHWLGAVGDPGDAKLMFQALAWKPGQLVDCMLKIEGRLQPVQFRIATISEESPPCG